MDTQNDAFGKGDSFQKCSHHFWDQVSGCVNPRGYLQHKHFSNQFFVIPKVTKQRKELEKKNRLTADQVVQLSKVMVPLSMK